MVVIEHSDAGRGLLVERPRDATELLDRLAFLAAKYRPICGIPYAVDLVREEGRLAVGMADDSWVLSFFPADGGSARNSLGNPAATGGTAFYFGDHTEMSNKYLIPRALAIDAVRQWCADGSLSAAVVWTEFNFSPAE